MMGTLIRIALTLGLALLVAWLGLIAFLVAVRPKAASLKKALRLLPDTLRLLQRLAKDGSLPRSIRIRLVLLLGYLACPFDLIPDFIPVLGHVDDAIIVLAVLRSVVRRAGPEPIRRHWPGTREGLGVLWAAAGLPDAATSP